MTDMDRFIADLDKASRNVVPMAAAALDRAVKVQEREMSKAFSGHRSFRHVPQAVDSRTIGLRAEVGVNKRKRQGAIANILAYGTSTQPPVVDHTRGMTKNVSFLQQALAQGMERLL